MKKALVLSLAVALFAGFAAFAQGELTGTWSVDITINPMGAVPDPNPALAGDGFFEFASDLTITYSVGGWDFTSTTAVDGTGWSAQSFDVAGAFGAFEISGGIVFDTAGIGAPQWVYLDTAFTFGSVAIGLDFDLYDGDIRLCLSGEATTGLVDITVDMCFGDLLFDIYGEPIASGNGLCDLDWQGVTITVDFPFCCADVSATLVIDCDGFQSACFSVDGIVVSNIPWFTLGAEVCFELETKTLTLTPEFDFGADICFDVYFEADDSGVTVGGAKGFAPLMLPEIGIVGIGVNCEIGGVSFSGLSYWGTGKKPGILYKTPYWEAYQIATTEDACCGPFDFSIGIYFDALSTYLFDVAAFKAAFSYELGDNFVFSMGLNYTAATGLTSWTIGFDISW